MRKQIRISHLPIILLDIEKQAGNFHLKVSFSNEHEFLGILGASGCGKSMTLKCIAGIEKPDRGSIVLDGRVLFDSEKKINLPPQQRHVGYLFQNYALFPNMTVRQNILCGVHTEKDRRKKRKKRTRSWICCSFSRFRIFARPSFPADRRSGQLLGEFW